MRALRGGRLAGIALVLAGLATSGLAAAQGSGHPAAPDRAAESVLAAARSEIGDAYEWAGTGPDVWDCSGLTYTLWRTVGGVRAIPRTSRDQQAWATPIRGEDALPGDLVFFGEPVSHVSIYLGDGQLIDASSSRKGVVQRAIWTSDVIRYGRVPREGAPVTPRPTESASPTAAASASASASTAASPQPSAKASATSKPKATPSPKATPKPTGSPRRSPAAKPTASPSPSATMAPVPQPGHRSRTSTTKSAAAFVSTARTAIGAKYEPGRSSPAYDAPGLVRWAWWKTTKQVLPADAAAMEKRTTPVALRDLAVGDLIFYGRPAVHVAVYVSNGEMVDASKVLKKVAQRRVFSSETVRFARIKP
ncbi:MAG TPA: NlpC/P60 family protein [Mycobacteriales bacterium]|nr:NlpC/P60 family protein [Mycobacteriales bacterium]